MTIAISRADAVRAQLLSDLEWFRNVTREGEKNWMRVAKNVALIRDNEWWRHWKSKSSKKSFTSFHDWLQHDAGPTRSTCYHLLDVAGNLKSLSQKQKESLGKSKCYELARVAREKPKLLASTIAKAEKVTVDEVKKIVSATLAGHHLEASKFVRMEFLLPPDDAKNIRLALVVAANMEGKPMPMETTVQAGYRLAEICQEFLTGEKQIQVKKLLKKARFEVGE